MSRCSKASSFDYVPDANTRVLKLRSSEADVADEIPYNQVASLNGAEGISVEIAKHSELDRDLPQHDQAAAR